MGSKSSKSSNNQKVTDTNHQRHNQSYQSSPNSLKTSSIPPQSTVITQNGTNVYNSPQHPYQSQYGHVDPQNYGSQMNNNHSPNNHQDASEQRSQSSKASKKSKDSKVRSLKPKEQTKPPTTNTPTPPEQNGSSGQPTGPAVQHMIPRAVFDRDEFIKRHQRNKKNNTVSGDSGHNWDRGEYYSPKKEVTKPSSSEGKSRDQRVTDVSARRTSRASSRTGSEALPPLSDVDTRSVGSSQEETPVIGFVQVLPSEPFDGWSNLHHTPVGQNYSGESRYSRGGDLLPETDY